MGTITRRSSLLLVATLAASFTGPVSAVGMGKGIGGDGSGGPFIKIMFAQAKQAFFRGDYPEAEATSRQALQMAERIGNPKPISVAYKWLGQTLAAEGKYAEAETVLRNSVNLTAQAFGERSRPASASLFNLGKVLVAEGQYAEAQTVLRRSLDIEESLDGSGAPEITKRRNHLAKVLYQLGRDREAETLLKQALASSEGSSDPEHTRIRSGTLLLMSKVMHHLRLYPEAEHYARQSLDLREGMLGDSHPDTRKSRDQLGRMLFEQGRAREAEPLLRAAMPLPDAAMNLALVLDSLGKPAEAEPFFTRAVEAVRQAGVPAQLARFARNYGHALAQQGRLRDALSYYRESLDAIDRLFANTRGLEEDVREQFIGRYTPYYRETIELLLRLHRAQPAQGYDREALSVVSRTQSRLFTEMLRQADVSKFSKNPAFAELRQQRQSLLDQIAALTRAKAAKGGEDDSVGDDEEEVADPAAMMESDPARETNLARQISTAEQSLQSVEERMWQDFPRFMELTQPRPITAEELQTRLLKPDEAVLTYALLPDQTLIFVLTPKQFRMVAVPYPKKTVTDLIRSVRGIEEKMSATGAIAVLQQLDPEELHQLYQILIEPVEADLAKAGHVLVVGDGPIQTLPLEMLVTRYGPAEQAAFAAKRKSGQPFLGEYATLSYLGERQRFVYLPSLASLPSQRLYPKPDEGYDRELVSFADPVFGNEGGTYSAATRSALLQVSRSVAGSGSMIQIPRLPETADEAKEIAHTLGGKTDLYLRDKAQEHTVKTLDLKHARYLHFATHGLLGGEFLLLKESERATDAGPGRERNLAVVAAPSGAPAPQPPPAQSASPEPNPTGATGGQPALVLTLAGDLQGEDGLLTMKEVIEDLDIDAQLVVLSACNTAGESSEANNGEGFAGLTRAFMYAGAKGLLVSHWSVESQSTQQLMAETFRQIKAGNSALSALQAARQTILNSRSADGGTTISRGHPYFWAPFVYVGGLEGETQITQRPVQ